MIKHLLGSITHKHRILIFLLTSKNTFWLMKDILLLGFIQYFLPVIKSVLGPTFYYNSSVFFLVVDQFFLNDHTSNQPTHNLCLSSWHTAIIIYKAIRIMYNFVDNGRNLKCYLCYCCFFCFGLMCTKVFKYRTSFQS